MVESYQSLEGGPLMNLFASEGKQGMVCVLIVYVCVCTCVRHVCKQKCVCVRVCVCVCVWVSLFTDLFVGAS